MRVGLLIGHKNNPSSRTGGRGAVFPAIHRDEVSLIEEYVITTTVELERLGHTVLILDSGSYSDRVRHAAAEGCDIVVHCHVNVGSRAGLVFFRYDERPPAFYLSTAIATALEHRLHPYTAHAQDACVTGYDRAAYVLTKGTDHKSGPYVVLVEPFSGDDTSRLWSSPSILSAVGIAIAEGIDAFSRSHRV